MNNDTALVNPASVEEINREIAPVVRQAHAITILSQDGRNTARVFLDCVKDAQKRVADFWSPIKQAAHIAWKRTCEGEHQMLDPLDSAEKTLKAKLLTYDDEEKRTRLIEQRHLQAIADERARIERQKVEQEVARQREIQRQKEQAAAEARWMAEQEENEVEQKRLIAEAEAAERKAASAAAKVEVKQEAAAAIFTPPIEIAAPEKQKGESTRKLRRARLLDKTALIQAAATGNELAASFLSFDQVAANRFAAAVKGAIHTPGIEWYEETILAIGGGNRS